MKIRYKCDNCGYIDTVDLHEVIGCPDCGNDTQVMIVEVWEE